METSSLALAATTLITLFFFLLLLHLLRNRPHKHRAPPSPPGAWPVIGHLHLLGQGEGGLPHLALAHLADQHGPLFTMQLGAHRALVASLPEAARECLGPTNRAFVSRSKTTFVEEMAFDGAMVGFSPYGTYWREIRKIITLKLLSNQRVEMSNHVRGFEVRSGIKAIHGKASKEPSGGVLVEMKEWFNDVSLNSIVRLVAGKSLKEVYQGEEYNKWRKGLRDWFDLAGVVAPADALPFLKWFDIGGYRKTMRRVAQEIDPLPQRWLQEHKRKRASGEEKNGGEQDFINVMLEAYENGEGPSGFDPDTAIKATSMGMILAGTDTTAVTLTWALSLLLNNRHALEKAQSELDTHVGKQRQVNESDLKNLVYLQAIIKETMRLYPAAPLSVPREAISDCTVSGYHIPAGTRLFVNVYKIQRDPRVWPEPLEFRPERFLTTHKDVDIRGQHFELMPFGAGRRICPGITFAMQSMQFTLASLLHGFEISTPGGEKVDMTEGFGLTNLKASPLEVILKPRLPDNLY